MINVNVSRLQIYNGKSIEEFTHIKEKSRYNHNYYHGFGDDILYAESDDDNYTEWFLCVKCDNGEERRIYFAYSYTDDGDVIIYDGDN